MVCSERSVLMEKRGDFSGARLAHEQRASADACLSRDREDVYQTTMTLYFTDSQIPELASLSREQRCLVHRGAYAMLRTERSSAISISGALIGAFIGGTAIIANGLSHVLGLDHKLPVMIGGGIVGGLIGSFISSQYLTRQLRPYFHRFIQENPDEIAKRGVTTGPKDSSTL